MGDRISISFETEALESPVLFCRFGGPHSFDLLGKAKKYAQKLLKERKGEMEPLDRFESETVMFQFICSIQDDIRKIDGKSGDNPGFSEEFYICKNKEDGDNSDNGHYTITFLPEERKIKVTHESWNKIHGV